jgi:hypothetical protein
VRIVGAIRWRRIGGCGFGRQNQVNCHGRACSGFACSGWRVALAVVVSVMMPPVRERTRGRQFDCGRSPLIGSETTYAGEIP